MTTALLIVDVQMGMFMMPGMTPHDGEATVERIAGLLKRARSSGISVIFVQHNGGPEDPFFALGKPGFTIHPKLAPMPGEEVIVKQKSSAFHGTDLAERLAAKEIDHLVIAGMQTEFCITSAIRGAYERGFKLTLASDCHTTLDTPVLPAAQIVTHHNFLSHDFAAVKPASDIAFA